MRYFIGIKLPDKITEELVRVQSLLQKEALFTGKYVEPENLHITLVFLGPKSDDEITFITKELTKVRYPKFKATLQKVEATKHVMWVTLQAPELIGLYDKLVTLIGHKEDRDYTGHITIARIKKVDDRQELKKSVSSLTIEPLSWQVDSFSLFHAETRQTGPVYTSIKTINLSGH